MSDTPRLMRWEPNWLPSRGTAGRSRWQEAFYQWRIVGFWRWWLNHLTDRPKR